MLGGEAATEFRVPWILRSLISQFASSPKYLKGNIALMPPLLGTDLVLHVRERFQKELGLRRNYQQLAEAVLQDSQDKDKERSFDLILKSDFVIRRKTAEKILSKEEIKSLVNSGYLKPVLHASTEYAYSCRLPELLLSELSFLLSKDLGKLIGHDVRKAAEWLARITSNLPLGDIMGAQVILDFIEGAGHVPFQFITDLLNMRPVRRSIRPGTRGAVYIPGTGMVELAFRENGTIIAQLEGKEPAILARSDPSDYEMYDMDSWLMLSHLCRYRLMTQFKDGKVRRIDPGLLMAIGSSNVVLRRPTGDPQQDSMRIHTLPDQSTVVCHKMGIIEPITLSLLNFFLHTGSDSINWIDSAVKQNSFPLISRIYIALTMISEMAEEGDAEWAMQVFSDVVKPAFSRFPNLHEDDEGRQGF